MKRRDPFDSESIIKVPKIIDTSDAVNGLANADSEFTQWSSQYIVKKAISMIEEITKCAIDGKETLAAIEKLYNLILPVIHTIKHSVEVIQIVHWLIKFAPLDICKSLVNELSDDMDCMIRSKRASLCVQSMLECGDSKLRERVIGSFLGNIVRYMNHPVSSSLIDIAYSKYACPKMKMFMRQELYCPMLKNIKDELIDELKQALIRFPLAKDDILGGTRAILKEIICKGLAVGYPLFHCVLLDYLNECNKKDKEELVIDLTMVPTVNLLNSKEGAFVILYMLELLQFELKQKMLEGIRSFIPCLTMSKDSYIFPLGLFYALNDLNLSRIYVIQKLLDYAETIASNIFGSCIYLYFLAPESKLYFKNVEGNGINDILIEKKIVRYGLENQTTLPLLLKDRLLLKIAQDAPKWLSNEHILYISEMAIKRGKGYCLKDAADAVCSYVCDPFERMDEGSAIVWPYECKFIHDFIIRMIQYDCKRDDGFKFSQSLVMALTLNTLSKWICTNNGCSILSTLLKSEADLKNLKSYLSSTNFIEIIDEFETCDDSTKLE